MLNKILAILLVGMTMIHGGWRRQTWEKEHGHMNQVARRHPKLTKQDLSPQLDYKSLIQKECKASEHLRVPRSLMANVNAI